MNGLERLLLFVCCFFLLFRPARGQELPFTIEMPVAGVTGYAEDIPEPEEVLEHVIGERHTRPGQIAAYFHAVAEASDRVSIVNHGSTYEGRPLLHAIITSPANHNRLEEIRQANLRLSESPGEIDEGFLESMPVIVYMGYSIHGNEASGSEAALLLLYHLAAGSGPSVQQVLDQAVVLLDPMMNPDGRDRFVDWVNRHRGAVPVSDPQDLEHREPWPGGRTNHYWFDLNRDWLPVEHPESQARLALFHHWRPQLVTDHHEMGSDATFFFQPGIPGRTNPNTPLNNQVLTERISKYHARALDRIGSLYYTRESFDDFYFGKGSTYPDINGSVGILFEQASSRGLVRETSTGVLSYDFTIRNHFAISLSSLEAAVNIREDLLRHQWEFYASALGFADSSPVKAYVIDIGRYRTRAQLFAKLLQRHRIRVFELARDVVAEDKTFRTGHAVIVPVAQQQARLIQVMMERTTDFRDSLFYDVSTWTLPLAYNLTCAPILDRAESYIGQEIKDVTLDGGRIYGGRSEYAYVMEWGRLFAPRALYQLQTEGIRPVLLNNAFTAEVEGQMRTFPAGTILVPVHRADLNSSAVHDIVERAALQNHVEVFALETGLSLDGPDMGTQEGSILVRPEVAILVGEGMSASRAGEVWHLLSERMKMGVSLLDVADLEDVDLNRYTTIVVAGGIEPSVTQNVIDSWIRGGGHLIGLSNSVTWLDENGLISIDRKEVDIDSLLQTVPFGQLDEARGAQNIGGSIFEARLDDTHPLAFGFGTVIPVLHTGASFYYPSTEPGTNVAVYTLQPLLSGYVSDEHLKVVGESASILARRVGRGSVIVFFDEPMFRAFWHGTSGLFLNAVFFGGSF